MRLNDTALIWLYRPLSCPTSGIATQIKLDSPSPSDRYHAIAVAVKNVELRLDRPRLPRLYSPLRLHVLLVSRIKCLPKPPTGLVRLLREKHRAWSIAEEESSRGMYSVALSSWRDEEAMGI